MEDRALLATVANQAGVAIENAQLSLRMRSLEKDLHQMDKLSALGTFASSLAHEIRNPLASIKTFCHLAGERFNDTKFVDRFKNIVPAEIGRLENILSATLDFGKNIETVYAPLRIEQVVDDLLDLVHYETFKYNARIIRRYSGDTPLVMGSQEQLKQVFMNLIINALQAMPLGGEITITTATLREEGKPVSVQVMVNDTGVGMADEVKEKLFKPFFTTKSEGTGLGLSIVRKIIREHNGSIDLQSELNKGTTFAITLPAVTP